MKKILAFAFILTLVVATAAFSGCAKQPTESGNAVTVKVGINNSLPPYVAIDEKGEITGYDVSVLREIDNRLPNYIFDIQALDMQTMLLGLESHSLAMADSQFAPTAERREKYIMPEQWYCLAPMVLTVREDSGIQSLEDMAGKNSIIDPASYAYTLLSKWNDEHPGKEIELQVINSGAAIADMFQMIADGRTDSFLGIGAIFDAVNADLGLPLVKTDVVIAAPTYLMLNKEETALAVEVSRVLKEMLDDGTLSKLLTESIGQDLISDYKDIVIAG